MYSLLSLIKLACTGLSGKFSVGLGKLPSWVKNEHYLVTKDLLIGEGGGIVADGSITPVNERDFESNLWEIFFPCELL